MLGVKVGANVVVIRRVAEVTSWMVLCKGCRRWSPEYKVGLLEAISGRRQVAGYTVSLHWTAAKAAGMLAFHPASYFSSPVDIVVDRNLCKLASRKCCLESLPP